jgi:uncharacterized protein (TIGR03437 family)
MTRNSKILAGKIASILSVPVILIGYAGGPDPRKTGAPGDSLCTEAGCHVGSPAGNSVEVQFPSGMTYTPGVTQRLKVVVNDATGRLFGFQLTARPASNERNGQAGTFTPSDARTQVLCEIGSPKPASGCQASAPLEFIEHRTASSSNTFEFDWTPPATDVGNVRIWVAANAANGNQQNTGDRIHTANYTLTPAAAPSRPTIRSDQPVLQAFSGMAGLSAGTWVEIYGTNLSSATREWAGSDFQQNRAPTQLEGVRVNINGRAAFVRYVSPTQVNVQAPDDDSVGPVNVEVINSNGTSNAVSVQKTRVSPALLTTPLFNVGGKQYLAALHADNQTFVGRENLIQGVAFRPARPGDIIIVYAVGCGPTNPASPAGQFFNEARALSSPFQIRFGETVAQAVGNLAAGAVGLCQFNVTVPNVADGDVQVNATVDGTATGQTLFTTVQR